MEQKATKVINGICKERRGYCAKLINIKLTAAELKLEASDKVMQERFNKIEAELKATIKQTATLIGIATTVMQIHSFY